MKQKYLEAVNSLSAKSIIGMIGHHQYKMIKDDILSYTSFLVYDENWSVRIFCYKNSITDYIKCEYGNLKKFTLKTCTKKKCQCRSKIYADSNKKKAKSQANGTIIQWKLSKNKLDEAPILSKKDTITLLLSKEFHYTKYLGKAKNRTFMKDNISLYKSVLIHTHKYKKELKNLSGQLLFLAKFSGDFASLKCKYCNSLVNYNANTRQFRTTCKLCYLTKESKKTYSEISQRLFEQIDTEGCKYKIKNGEFYIRNNDAVYAYDFVYKNKIIEFNGDMWHMNPSKYNRNHIQPFTKKRAETVWSDDDKKLATARQNGFDVLVVWESEFLHDAQKETQKCLDFLHE